MSFPKGKLCSFRPLASGQLRCSHFRSVLIRRGATLNFIFRKSKRKSKIEIDKLETDISAPCLIPSPIPNTQGSLNFQLLKRIFESTNLHNIPRRRGIQVLRNHNRIPLPASHSHPIIRFLRKKCHKDIT